MVAVAALVQNLPHRTIRRPVAGRVNSRRSSGVLKHRGQVAGIVPDALHAPAEKGEGGEGAERRTGQHAGIKRAGKPPVGGTDVGRQHCP